ncbi:MAG TPA: CAP domain-containing protein [Polyangiaceae bacterium]|nr:CAP domain-containing protein [Polyangiaceae bacterium]
MGVSLLRSLIVVAVAVLAVACKKKEQPPQPYATYPAYPAPGPAPAGAPGGVPAPAATPAGAMAPALGFPCVSDAELQCPFGRCLSSRCGGCTSSADCKAGAQCVPTWLGQACLPGAAPAAPPVAAPVPTPAAAPAPAPQQPSSDAFEQARQLCVARTNDYRARSGIAPVSRRADREGCGDGEARSDSVTRTAHGAFGQCGERAQNECPGWAGAPEDVIERCLAMMFAEGPGPGAAHGHYTNMMDRNFRSVACGMFRTGSGELWVVQNFYP